MKRIVLLLLVAASMGGLTLSAQTVNSLENGKYSLSVGQLFVLLDELFEDESVEHPQGFVRIDCLHGPLVVEALEEGVCGLFCGQLVVDEVLDDR